jgi:hypothetical protein
LIKSNHYKLSSVVLSNQDSIDRFLEKNNFSLEVSDDLELIKKILTTQPEDLYPYRFDAAFNRDYIGEHDFFCLFLKDEHNNIIATYAAREVKLKTYLEDMKNYFHQDQFSNDLVLVSKNFKKTWYSSLQWVSDKHRGKNIGLILDYIKKSVIFECFDGTVNFSTHKVDLTDYHLQKLKYDKTEWFMTIVHGEAGRVGDKSEKVYNISHIKNDHWAKIKDAVYNLYI